MSNWTDYATNHIVDAVHEFEEHLIPASKLSTGR
jgi:hypothetical protein